MRILLLALVLILSFPTFVFAENSLVGSQQGVVVPGSIGPIMGILVKSGTNGKIGTCTLSAGVCTVANTSITSTSLIFLTTKNPLGVIGIPNIKSQTTGTGFTIQSTSLLDLSVIGYLIIEAD